VAENGGHVVAQFIENDPQNEHRDAVGCSLRSQRARLHVGGGCKCSAGRARLVFRAGEDVVYLRHVTHIRRDAGAGERPEDPTVPRVVDL
jgi:hypothetical protein